MSRAAALVCSDCGASPTQRHDQVSDAATGYTCSRCLMGGGYEAISGAQGVTEGHPTGSPTGPSSAPEISMGSETIKRDIDPVKSGRGFRAGRARLSEAERRQHNRDRQRRCRRDQRGSA